MNDVSGEKVDFERGLEVIENRSESLNRSFRLIDN